MSKSENIALYKYLTRSASPEPQDASSNKIKEVAPTANINDRNIRIKQGTPLKMDYFRHGTRSDDPARLKRIDDFVKEYEKTYGQKPSAKKIRTSLKEQRRVIPFYEAEYGKLPVGKKGGAGRTVIFDEVNKILNDSKVKERLQEGKFPTIQQAKRILKKNIGISESRLIDVAEKLKETPEYQNIAEEYLEKAGKGSVFGGRSKKRSRVLYEKQFSKMMDLPYDISTVRKYIAKDIAELVPELKGIVNADEIGSITASMKRGSGPYAIFGQLIGSDFNTDIKGKNLDRAKSLMENKLTNLPIDSFEREKIKNEYNEKVLNFEDTANQNNPIKKVKGMKLSFDPPSKTIKNKKIYNQYKDLFDDHYEKYGFSYEVDKDTDSILDIQQKLRKDKNFQKKIKDNFNKLIKTQGATGAVSGITNLSGTGWSLAAEAIPGSKYTADFIQGFADDIMSKSYGKAALKGLGIAGAAYGVYDTGVALKEGKSLPETTARLFGLDVPYQKLREYNRLTDEEQEIQKRVNQQRSFDAALQDPLDEGLMTMRPRPEVAEEDLLKLEQGKQRVAAQVEAEESERAASRKGLVETVKEKISEISGQPYELSFAGGGRVQLSDGGKPKDLSRRKFIKIGTGLIAAIPFIGKFSKPVTKAAPEVIEAVTRTADQMPAYLAKLIEKVKMMGTSKIIGKMDSPDEFIRYDLGDYELYEGAGGARLKRVRDRGEYGYEEFEMQIKKDPETDFVEYEEVSVRPDEDGKMKDVDFGIDDDIHQEMKKFADED